MPFIPAPNVGQFNLLFSLDGQTVENVFHSRFASAPDVTTLGLVGLAYKDWWVDNMAPILSPDISLVQVVAVDLTTDSGATATVITDLPHAGSNGESAVPNNVALCVSLRTANRGRSFRGRSYVAGLGESSVTVSRVNTILVGQIVSAYNELITTLQGIDAPLVVVSKFHDRAARTEAVSTAVETALCIDNVVDSQRRRLPGRGT